jgi:hypothetical protein
MHSVLHRSTHSEPDYLSLELMAICAVGKALEVLEDPEARLRVLRWANERYQPRPTEPTAVIASPVVAPAHVPAVAAPAPAPALPVLRLAEGPFLHLALAPELESEIERRVDIEFAPSVESEPETNLTVDSLDDLFDVDAPVGLSLAPIAPASARPGETEDLSDLYEPPSDKLDEQPIDLHQLPDEPGRPQLHLVSREEQPFEQLIDDFVENLRKLTRECLDV